MANLIELVDAVLEANKTVEVITEPQYDGVGIPQWESTDEMLRRTR